MYSTRFSYICSYRSCLPLMHFAFEWLCVFRPIPAIEVRCSSSVCLACWREPDHAAKAVNKTQSKKDPKSMSIWSDISLGSRTYWSGLELILVFAMNFHWCLNLVSDYLMTNDANDIAVLHSHTSQLNPPRVIWSWNPDPDTHPTATRSKSSPKMNWKRRLFRINRALWPNGVWSGHKVVICLSTMSNQISSDYSNRAFYGKKPETAFRGCYRLPPDCCAHEDCTLRCIQIQSIQYRWNPFARRWRMWWDGTCGQPCCAPNTWCRKLKLLTFLGFFSWYCMCALSAYSNQLFVYDKVFSMVLTCSTHFYMMFQHQLKGFAPTTWNSEWINVRRMLTFWWTNHSGF